MLYHRVMKFDEYQEAIKKYDLFEKVDDVKSPGFSEKILGLVGEAGETADKFKKIIRDKNGKISAADKKEINKELGDVLWYVATIARYLDTPFDEIARGNVDKLQKRLENNKLHGEGDNR